MVDRSIQADSHSGNQLNNKKLVHNAKVLQKGRPICISNLFVNWPCMIICLSFVVLLLLSFYCWTLDYLMVTPENTR